MIVSLYSCPCAVNIILAESQSRTTPQYGSGMLCRDKRSSLIRFDSVLTVWMKEWRHVPIGTNSDESRLQALEVGEEVLELLFAKV
jgi:hypothetical protein